LVIDVSPVATSDAVSAFIRVAKRFVCDSKCCVVFVTLPTSLLGLIPVGEKRIEYIHIGAFLNEEMLSYFEILKTLKVGIITILIKFY
jgi:hypothetical protein